MMLACSRPWPTMRASRSEEHTSELQSQSNLVCRLLLEKKKNDISRLLLRIYPPAGANPATAIASRSTRLKELPSVTRVDLHGNGRAALPTPPRLVVHVC